MKAALFNIGDKVKRIDCDDQKIYTIDKIRKHKGYWIYSMEGQGWKDGWAWVSEWNIKRCDTGIIKDCNNCIHFGEDDDLPEYRCFQCIRSNNIDEFWEQDTFITPNNIDEFWEQDTFITPNK